MIDGGVFVPQRSCAMWLSFRCLWGCVLEEVEEEEDEDDEEEPPLFLD